MILKAFGISEGRDYSSSTFPVAGKPSSEKVLSIKPENQHPQERAWHDWGEPRVEIGAAAG